MTAPSEQLPPAQALAQELDQVLDSVRGIERERRALQRHLTRTVNAHINRPLTSTPHRPDPGPVEDLIAEALRAEGGGAGDLEVIWHNIYHTLARALDPGEGLQGPDPALERYYRREVKETRAMLMVTEKLLVKYGEQVKHLRARVRIARGAGPGPVTVPAEEEEGEAEGGVTFLTQGLGSAAPSPCPTAPSSLVSSARARELVELLNTFREGWAVRCAVIRGGRVGGAATTTAGFLVSKDLLRVRLEGVGPWLQVKDLVVSRGRGTVTLRCLTSPVSYVLQPPDHLGEGMCRAIALLQNLGPSPRAALALELERLRLYQMR